MQMNRFAVAAALAAIVVATIALAAPAAAAEPDARGLAGFRVEALAGYEGEDGTGILYGIGAGFDLAAGPLLFGVEAEAMESGAESCVADPISTLCAWAGRDLYAGARAGIAVGTGGLVYVKAGYSNSRVKVEYDPAAGPTQVFVDDYEGFRAGGGVQIDLGRNLFAKGEYRFTSYRGREEKHQGVAGIGLRF